MPEWYIPEAELNVLLAANNKQFAHMERYDMMTFRRNSARKITHGNEKSLGKKKYNTPYTDNDDEEV